ncbi:MAG: hypothetical protein V1740_05095 [Candidatus Woesearchaeota archaeon]
MVRNKCIVCGSHIFKSGLYDPYICRSCERDTNAMEVSRYAFYDE